MQNGLLGINTRFRMQSVYWGSIPVEKSWRKQQLAKEEFELWYTCLAFLMLLSAAYTDHEVADSWRLSAGGTPHTWQQGDLTAHQQVYHTLLPIAYFNTLGRDPTGTVSVRQSFTGSTSIILKRQYGIRHGIRQTWVCISTVLFKKLCDFEQVAKLP